MVACGGDEPAHQGGGGSTAGICDQFDTPCEDIVAGMVKVGDAGSMQVKLVSTAPAPPNKGKNVWTVALLDMNDAPLFDAIITKVRPWMPDHGHGASVSPEIGSTGADGTVTVSNIEFRMNGVWTLTFTIDNGGAADTVTFGIFIDG